MRMSLAFVNIREESELVLELFGLNVACNVIIT